MHVVVLYFSDYACLEQYILHLNIVIQRGKILLRRLPLNIQANNKSVQNYVCLLFIIVRNSIN